MNNIFVVLGLFTLLLMPVYASAQSSDRITVLDTFGDYDRGDSLFIYGHVAIVDDSFLIMQIINPHGGFMSDPTIDALN